MSIRWPIAVQCQREDGDVEGGEVDVSLDIFHAYEGLPKGADEVTGKAFQFASSGSQRLAIRRTVSAGTPWTLSHFPQASKMRIFLVIDP